MTQDATPLHILCMPGHAFTAAERKDASLLAELAYTNPFLPVRIERERAILGRGFAEAAVSWNVDALNPTADPNNTQLQQRARELAEKLRARAMQGGLSEEEGQLYADLVLFVLYHEFLEPFIVFIDRAHRDGTGQRTLPFLKRFLAADAYWREPVSGQRGFRTPEELLAAFFQVVRAFHHIFRFLAGTGEAATRLRARVWQAIFTHDMRRFARGIDRRMRDIPTLVTGPSGSGKEVVARAVSLSLPVPFDLSERKFSGDFIRDFHPVNLAALSPHLIESELFGHVRGAYTGALEDRLGYFEACGAYGAVFLDEIGETAPSIQVKLLRVLQTRQFQRLGDTSLRRFEGKVIAATNRTLEEEIAAGRFREDFYYRLCADQITTPHLVELIGGSAEELHRLALFAANRLVGSDEAEALTQEMVAWQERHPDYGWPGNFRELEQALRQMLVSGDYLPGSERQGATQTDWIAPVQELSLNAEELMRLYARKVLAKNGNLAAASRHLELDRRTVRKYVESGSEG